MPNVKKKKEDKNSPKGSLSRQTSNVSENHIPPARSDNSRFTKFLFHCQLAHGSPTGIISGFTNVKELYARIADCYQMDPTDIMFCTVNNHKLDMNCLLGVQIGMEDFIFAHVKGQKKEVEIIKSEERLGITVTDNGNGYCFVKSIKPNSIIDQCKAVEIGDLVEKVDDISFIGKRHFNLANSLKRIPVNSLFKLRLISPEKAPFSMLQTRTNKLGTNNNAGIGDKRTLRIRSNGCITEEDVVDNTIEFANTEKNALKSIGALIEETIGIDDPDMSQTIWDISKSSANLLEFTANIEREFDSFQFPEELVFDFWGAITDAKNGISSRGNSQRQSLLRPSGLDTPNEMEEYDK